MMPGPGITASTVAAERKSRKLRGSNMAVLSIGIAYRAASQIVERD
jgi:hypothetical protein